MSPPARALPSDDDYARGDGGGSNDGGNGDHNDVGDGAGREGVFGDVGDSAGGEDVHYDVGDGAGDGAGREGVYSDVGDSAGGEDVHYDVGDGTGDCAGGEGVHDDDGDGAGDGAGRERGGAAAALYDEYDPPSVPSLQNGKPTPWWRAAFSEFYAADALQKQYFLAAFPRSNKTSKVPHSVAIAADGSFHFTDAHFVQESVPPRAFRRLAVLARAAKDDSQLWQIAKLCCGDDELKRMYNEYLGATGGLSRRA